MPLAPWLRLLRPHHVAKNAFVLLPAPFAAAAGHRVDLATLLLGFAAFSLVPAGGYALNDAIDARRDRLHPVKRRRPVAAGEVPARGAAALGGGLALAGLGALAFVADGRALPLAAAYLGVALVYTFGGKHVPVVDVLLLAAGFLLRIAIGCRIIDAPPSDWLLLCGAAVALFLALGKRRADLDLGVGAEHRPSLAGYTVRRLDIAMAAAALVSLAAYALYARTSPVFLPDRRFAGLPFVLAGLLLALRRLRREPERSPVDVALRAPEILLALIGYALATTWSLGAIG